MVCCYNSEKYISETIDSILNQTYTHWEIIAVNDGSTDGTEKIIKGYIKAGVPIVYYSQANKGLTNARNKAIELSNNDWIAVIDHDDICMPDRLEKQAADIKNNMNCHLFFGNCIHFNDDEKKIREQFDFIYPCDLDLSAGNATSMLLKHGNFIDMETVVFNKNAAINIGGFNKKYKYITDYDFLIKMSNKYNFYCNPEILSKYRIHDDQMTQTMQSDSIKEHLEFYYLNIKDNNSPLLIRIRLLIKYIKLLKLKIIS
jgi:glycosyltransferase involved in cell wall biosynthesis